MPCVVGGLLSGSLDARWHGRCHLACVHAMKTPHHRPLCLPACPPPTDLLNRLGLYLRSRKLAPDVQLKRFIQQHCAGHVVVLES